MSAQALTPGILEFESATHTYRLDGAIIPGVTSVLKAARIVDYSFIPQDVLQAASRRGTAVHQALQYLDEGMLDRDSLDPTIAGYVEACERFYLESRFTVAHIEQRVCHRVNRFAGTLDRTGTFADGSLAIVDFKSGIVLPGHAVQLAAYVHCLPKPRRFRRIALQLCADGTYRVHEFPQANFQRDVELFLAALACHNFTQKGNIAL